MIWMTNMVLSILRHFVITIPIAKKKKKGNIIAMFWVEIVWSIWIARNNLIFNGIPCMLDDIIGNIKFIS